MVRVLRKVLGLGSASLCCACMSWTAYCDRTSTGLGELLVWGGGTGDCFGGGTTAVKLPRNVKDLPLVRDAAIGCAVGAAIDASGGVYAISRRKDSDTMYAAEAEKLTKIKARATSVAVAPSDEVLVTTNRGYLMSISKDSNSDSDDWGAATTLEGEHSRSTIVDVTCGTGHCVAISSIGEAFAWGRNECGQLGHGTKSDKAVEFPKRMRFPKHVEVEKASCGDQHTAIVDKSGQLWTCGSDEWCQAGHTEEPWLLSDKNVVLPTVVEKLRKKKIHDVDCGGEHTVAVVEDGTVFTTGLGRWGQLGHHNFVHFAPVHAVQGFDGTGKRATSASAGANHTQIISTDGRLYACGANEYGQLGNAGLQPSALPGKVKGEARRSKVAKTISARDASAAIVPRA